MYPYILTSTISLLCVLLFGAYALRADPRHPVFRSFALCMFSIGFYLFAEIVGLTAQSLRGAILWGRFSYVSAFWIATAFVYFTLMFSGKTEILSHRFMPYLLFVPAVSFLSFLFNDALVNSVTLRPNFRQVSTGYLFPFFEGYFLGFFAYGTFNLIQAFRASSTFLRRTQVAYVLTGVISGGLFALFSIFILPVLYLQPSSLTGLSFVILGGFMAYAIFRQRPLDIEVIFRKSSIYWALVIMVIGTYILGVKTLGSFLGKLFGSSHEMAETLLIVALAFIFWPAAQSLEGYLTRKFFPGYLDVKKLLLDFSESLIYHVDLRKLSRLIVNTVADALSVETSVLCLRLENNQGFEVIESRNLASKTRLIEWLNEPSLLSFLKSRNKPLTTQDFQENLPLKDSISALVQEGFSLLIPLVIKGECIGVLALGEKTAGTSFSEDEITLLSTLSNQAAVALENAFVYEEMRRTYLRLSQAERMAALGELSAGLAHEIRNPLSNIKGSAEILKKTVHPVEREKFANFVLEEVERLNRLLMDFLSFARPRPPKVQSTSLNSLIEKTVQLMGRDFESNGTSLTLHLHPDNLFVKVDPDQWQQVFLNLFLNAKQAMEKGGVLTVSTSVSDIGVQIDVQDTGCGIAMEHIDKIFHPFFTTKERGTGLGLAVVYRIVQESGGQVSIESHPGKGTKVSLQIPLSAHPDAKEKQEKALTTV